MPAHERLLQAFFALGFQFKDADYERGRIPGSTLPFYQEVEFFLSSTDQVSRFSVGFDQLDQFDWPTALNQYLAQLAQSPIPRARARTARTT